MRKILLIGWKDLTLAFRDRAALLLTLAAPFCLILGLGFVTGHFSGSSGGLGNIGVVLVNQDGAQLGNALVSVFQSSDLADLVTPTVLDDPADRAAAGGRGQGGGRGHHPGRLHCRHHPGCRCSGGRACSEHRALCQSDQPHQRRRDRDHRQPVPGAGGGRTGHRPGGGDADAARRADPAAGRGRSRSANRRAAGDRQPRYGAHHG